MDITKCASAGTMESSDVYVEIEPAENGITLDLQSVVQAQYGDAILAAVRDVLAQEGVENALECVIRARVEAAIHRGKGEV